jgi:hypothetical protein
MFRAMSVRRLVSILSVCVVASATVVAAQPKKAPPTADQKKAPVAPAKDTGAAATPGSDSGSAGSAVQMTEDPPPSDMNGTDENPDAPHAVSGEDNAAAVVVVPPAAKGKSGYPIEEALRPITLPQNMSEVSIAPHAQLSPFMSGDALRARYGITRQVQLGLTYVFAGIFDDPATLQQKQGIHAGKAVGLDVTVLLQDWIGVRLGVPFYVNPIAVSIALGAPIKFKLTDKFALGGLDDLLNIKVKRFAPTFYQEAQNAAQASNIMLNTISSAGELRFSFYGIFQYQPNFAIIGRAGIQMEDFATGKTDGCAGECLTTFIHAGFDYSPRKYLDLGLNIGFDDLAHGGSFAPAGFLAVRI